MEKITVIMSNHLIERVFNRLVTNHRISDFKTQFREGDFIKQQNGYYLYLNDGYLIMPLKRLNEKWVGLTLLYNLKKIMPSGKEVEIDWIT